MRVPFLSTMIVFIYDFYFLIIFTILKRCHLDSSMSFNLKCLFSVDILSYPALQSFKVGLSNEKYLDFFFYLKKILVTFSIFIITSGLKQYLFTKIWGKKSFKSSPFFARLKYTLLGIYKKNQHKKFWILISSLYALYFPESCNWSKQFKCSIQISRKPSIKTPNSNSHFFYSFWKHLVIHIMVWLIYLSIY